MRKKDKRALANFLSQQTRPDWSTHRLGSVSSTRNPLFIQSSARWRLEHKGLMMSCLRKIPSSEKTGGYLKQLDKPFCNRLAATEKTQVKKKLFSITSKHSKFHFPEWDLERYPPTTSILFLKKEKEQGKLPFLKKQSEGKTKFR